LKIVSLEFQCKLEIGELRIVMENLSFNSKLSTIMHIDLNSCFATIEQQANPHLRGKPIAVAAYTTHSGCILAPSIEAKRYGIQTGMRVKDGKALYSKLIVLPADPWKYRNVHLALRKILKDYTNDFNPKSIDEFVLNLEGYPTLLGRRMQDVGREIKTRIKKEIGEWLTVSIGIAPNRFLAKTASSFRKPDGLEEINKDNFLEVYRNLTLIDLCGIKKQNEARLGNMGIHSVLDFYKAPVWKLKAAFSSIVGYYWYVRLHGYELDDVVFGRRSYGNSYAFPKPLITPEQIAPILTKLVEKMGFRLRRAGYKARGVHVAVTFRDGSFWHKSASWRTKVFFDSRDIYRQAFKILCDCPYLKPACRQAGPVRDLSVSVFSLLESGVSQLELFEDIEKRESVVKAVDEVNERWGNFVITPARMLTASDAVPDRIAFGNIKELEEFTIRDTN
jgi:DNA polymerase-4